MWTTRVFTVETSHIFVEGAVGCVERTISSSLEYPHFDVDAGQSHRLGNIIGDNV